MSQPARLNFWLLTAATICVDAVAMTLVNGDFDRYASALYFGLTSAQVSLLCIWASYSAARRLWHIAAPFAFGLLAALWIGRWWREENADMLPRIDISLAHLGLWSTHAALLLAVIWLLKHTSLQLHQSSASAKQRIRFSIMHLLVVTTGLALLIAVLESASLIHSVWGIFIALVANDVALAIAILLDGRRQHAIVRLAAIAGIASLLGLLLSVVVSGDWEAVATNLIQAILIFLWLELGEILPKRHTVDAADISAKR